MIRDLTDNYLQELVVPARAKCNDITCDDPCHIEEIEKLYDDVTDC